MALSIRDTNSPSSPKRTASPLESDLGTPHKLLPSSTSPRPRRRSLQATSPKVIKRPWHDEVRAATAAARRCTSPPAAAACAAAPLPPPCAAAPPLLCAASASAAPLSRAHHRAGGRARADDGGAARAAQLVGDRREPARPRGQAVPRAVSASRRAAQSRTERRVERRWQNHLSPDVRKGPWSDTEEEKLIRAHRIWGNRWAEISKQLPCVAAALSSQPLLCCRLA